MMVSIIIDNGLAAMRRDIDVALLRAYVAVAESGGMTNAGRLLNLTQAAVSQQIKRLEDLFERQLFDRTRRQIALTAHGERLFSYARRVVALNDEIYGFMTSPEFEGQVHLGVPHDLISSFMPPILRNFGQAWPRVQVTLVDHNSPVLRERLAAGEIDLTLATEITPQGQNGALLTDRLVWVGAKGGEAYKHDPLPVAIGGGDCAFREPIISVLRQTGRDWRFTCDSRHMEPLLAVVKADLAVIALLTCSIPEGLEVLPTSERMPELPVFHINLHIPDIGGRDLALELARHIRSEFANRFQAATRPGPQTERAA